MTKKKGDFPIKYLRKGLLTDEDYKDETKKKLKRKIRKP